jgi:hypothetical protein
LSPRASEGPEIDGITDTQEPTVVQGHSVLAHVHVGAIASPHASRRRISIDISTGVESEARR